MMSLDKSKYVMVNIRIPILLHNTGTYDSYPEHISVEYTPIERLPEPVIPNYELNLADYFPQEDGLNRENLSSEEPTTQTISPLQGLLTEVSERKYIEICNKNKTKIQKSNTTFRNKSTHRNLPKKDFTRKCWKYMCEVNDEQGM